MISGREGEAPIERPERITPPTPIDRELQIAEAERQIQECLAAGHAGAAYKLAQRTRQQIPDWELPEHELLAIIQAFPAREAVAAGDRPDGRTPQAVSRKLGPDATSNWHRFWSSISAGPIERWPCSRN